MADETKRTLNSEDQSRMRRLSEEITARYFEMATILERTLGSEGMRQRAFAPGGRVAMTFMEQKAVGELPKEACFCVEIDGGHYINPPGESAPGPCPGG